MPALIIRRLALHLRPAATCRGRLLRVQAGATPHTAAMSTSGPEHAIASTTGPPASAARAAAAAAAATPDASEVQSRRPPDPGQGQDLGTGPADPDDDGHSQRPGGQQQERLLLEDRRRDGTPATRLDLSGGATATAKLDHLGPLVVNEDGTLSRIANWAGMNDVERTNAARILGKRNQLRLARLRAAREGEGEQSGGA